MKLLADECCDAALVSALRRDGHDVLYAVESLRGFDATDRALKVPRLRDLLEHEAARLPGAFVVLEVDKIRIRPLL